MSARLGRSRWLFWAAAGFATATVAWLVVVGVRPGRPPLGGGAGAGRTEHLETGEVLYTEHCASCHGADLQGQPDWRQRLPDGRYPAPPHDETGHTWHHADDYLFAVTKRGGQVMASPGFPSGMPGFEESLSDAEIWSILEFIKSQWPREIQKRQRRVPRH